MASSDVEIVVNERVEGDAIEKVASASKDAAKNAKELIKLIDSLSVTLEGINGDAAGQLAVGTQLEPHGLAAGNDLRLRNQLVNGLARQLAVFHHDGLDGVAVGKGRKVDALDQVGHVLCTV